ncbi:MAG: hypothetical protein WKF79_03055 [Nocardioides sp.]
MQIHLHGVAGAPLEVGAIARPAYDHYLVCAGMNGTAWGGGEARPIATIDAMHTELGDLLGLAHHHQEAIAVEGQAQRVSYVFPTGQFPRLEVRTETDDERDRSKSRSMDERFRAVWAPVS